MQKPHPEKERRVLWARFEKTGSPADYLAYRQEEKARGGWLREEETP